MSYWRQVAEFSQGRTREELISQAIEDWQIWASHWNPEGVVVLPDARDLTKKRRIRTYSANNQGSIICFAADRRDDLATIFYLPASPDDKDAIPAIQPRHEGYWRRTTDESSDLPWPVPDEEWAGREEFLAALQKAEEIAEKVSYRGFSRCRICGIPNGSRSLRLDEWDWPEGFRHYVAGHNVRPSADFEAFIQGCRG